MLEHLYHISTVLASVLGGDTLDSSQFYPSLFIALVPIAHVLSISWTPHMANLTRLKISCILTMHRGLFVTFFGVNNEEGICFNKIFLAIVIPASGGHNKLSTSTRHIPDDNLMDLEVDGCPI